MRKPILTRGDLGAYALFLLLPCVLLWPVILRGEALLPLQYVALFSPWQDTVGRTLSSVPPWNSLLADSILQYLPWRQFTHESLRSGFIPLWNPHQFCGTPFLANYQSALFYPPNLLFWLLPAVYAFGASAILHLFLAGALVYVYLRGRGVGRGAALLGGVTFELSGFLLAWLELPTAVNVIVWLPLALHLYERSRRDAGILRGAPTVFPVAMILLAGHPQFAFYAVLAFAAYAVVRVPEGPNLRARAGMLAACAGVPLLLSGLLAAAQVLPMLELSRLSHRGGGPLLSASAEGFRGQALPWWASVVLFLPDFFGNPMRGGFWGPVNRAEFVGYTGVLPLLLAAVAILGLLLSSTRGRWRTSLPEGGARLVGFFGVLAVLAVAASFRNPLGEAIYSVIPGLGRFGSPGRMLSLSTLAIALLAGFGAHALARQAERARLAGLAAVLVAVGGIVVWLSAAVGASGLRGAGPDALLTSTMPQAARFGGFLALSVGVLASGVRIPSRVGLALLVLLLGGDLLAAGWGLNPTAPASLAYPPDPALSLLRRDPDARFAAQTRRWALDTYPETALPPNAATACGLQDVNGYDSLYGMAYKSYLDRLAGGETSPQANGNMVLFAPRRAEDLRSLACRYLVTLDPVEDPALEPVLDGAVRIYRLRGECPRGFIAGKPEGAASPGGRAVVQNTAPTRVDVQVTAPAEGWLVLRESYFPGWKALVDGMPAPVTRAREVFRAVRVPAGAQSVALSYQPASFRVGLFLSLIGLMLIIGCGTARRVVRKEAVLPTSGKHRDKE